ncbi:MAG TPA: M24 family metallopeptidase [Aggregatilineales bacterium]|nr:M24 family metallopeptidase [Aggregatilineales bacterium]
MALDFSIQNEKLDQAASLLKEHNMDAWLIFVRETSMQSDPSLDLILGLDITWLSAFIITKKNERIAIVGRYDAENIRRIGSYTEVIAYDANPFPDLIRVLERLDPEFIGVNYSDSDVASDGLSHGLWLRLQRGLGHTRFKHRLISAERMIASLRGRKSPAEIERVWTAVKTTESIIQAVTEKLAPGQNAVELQEFVLQQMRERDVSPAWTSCPTVTIGADAPVGHVMPDERFKTLPGQLVHIDLGVRLNGYVSDLQRVWYFKKPDEDSVPETVQEAFGFVRQAILAAAAVLKPGAQGWEVDTESRKLYREAGYPEYQHAVGHQIGRSVHDGATVLAPLWERYGSTSKGIVEAGNIYTLELGHKVPGYGYVGLEDDVLVRETSLIWLSTPQPEIIVVGEK